MKICLYGIPCAGKTTLMHGVSGIKTISGSLELDRMAGGHFSELSEEARQELRVKYTDYLKGLPDNIILSDGHYSFLEKVVFTEADAETYDVFLYLYCRPEVIKERLSKSKKNQSYAKLSVSYIAAWQQFEMSQLRAICHDRNKDFYVIPDIDISAPRLSNFIRQLAGGFSSYHLAQELVVKIRACYPQPCALNICDGDKTIIKQDTFRECCNFKTSVFDGDFYTGYQSFRFSEEVCGMPFDYSRLGRIELNQAVYDRVKENYVVLSSGVPELWEKLGTRLGLAPVFADTRISADTKYFVVKRLRQLGYQISAYGDSRNDLYMLQEADVGYLNVGQCLSRSLNGVDLHGIKLIYDQAPYVLMEQKPKEFAADVAKCKSSSGVNGAPLAAAHLRLGQAMGGVMKEVIPASNAAVIVLDRGGRFFGDGLYSAFGGTYFPYNPSKENTPEINKDIVVIVDAVINTGKSLLQLIEQLKQRRPGVEIFIAANVIQHDSLEKFSQYKLFVVRTSENSFVGKNQAVQHGKSGPDTADRLFNLIKTQFF